MQSKPLILITNDDGIGSPGLVAAAQAVAPLGDVLIVAPHQQQSGAGRSYRKIIDRRVHRHTIHIDGRNITAFSIDGTPAQAAGKGVLDLADRPVALAVSGINFGENIGSGIASSGTVGAALELAAMNIPALAVSLQTPREFYFTHSDNVNFSAAAHFTHLFAQKILAGITLPFDVDVLKIDIPTNATPNTPWRITTVSRQPYHHGVPSHPDNRGKQIDPGFDTRVDFETLEPGSDIYAVVVDGVISVAPISLDMSSRVSLPEMRKLLNGHK